MVRSRHVRVAAQQVAQVGAGRSGSWVTAMSCAWLLAPPASEAALAVVVVPYGFVGGVGGTHAGPALLASAHAGCAVGAQFASDGGIRPPRSDLRLIWSRSFDLVVSSICVRLPPSRARHPRGSRRPDGANSRELVAVAMGRVAWRIQRHCRRIGAGVSPPLNNLRLAYLGPDVSRYGRLNPMHLVRDLLTAHSSSLATIKEWVTFRLKMTTHCRPWRFSPVWSARPTAAGQSSLAPVFTPLASGAPRTAH